MNKGKINYKSSGVNIDEGQKFIEDIKSLTKKKDLKNALSNIGSFSGYVKPPKKYKDPVFALACERPDLEFTNSKPKHSYMLNDQLIFLNFWADWCAPCIKEFPYFNELDKNPNVTVIGFHFDQFDVLEDEVVEGFIKKFNIQFLNLKTDPRDIWGVDIPNSVPTILIIKNNSILKTITTPQTLETLESLVQDLS